MALRAMRERAIALRHAGLSINQITGKLKAKKSTVSYWCRDIQMSASKLKALQHRKVQGGRLGVLRAAEIKRGTRIAATEQAMLQGSKDIGHITLHDTKLIGLGLYWGEGYKRGNDECGFTNSDPAIICFFIRWMERVYGIKREDFILRVSINEQHKKRTRQIETFWSKMTGIPRSQFTKPSFIFASSKKTSRDPSSYFGTLRVKVRRATSLRRRILGSFKEIEKQT